MSNIFAFDAKLFREMIVPSLIEGESNPFIQNEIALLDSLRDSPLSDFINLGLVMKLFNDDLTECKVGKRFAADENGVYETEKVFSRPHSNCWTYEALTCLFESLIIRHCARYFLSIGKIYQLEMVINSVDNKAQDLIIKWGQSASVWNHGSGGFGEGISGWINEKEVSELNQLNYTLELNSNNGRANFNLLKSIRGLIELSATEGLGLLYGNDIRKCIVPQYSYYEILRLTGIEENIYNGWPAFSTQIVKDYS